MHDEKTIILLSIPRYDQLAKVQTYNSKERDAYAASTPILPYTQHQNQIASGITNYYISSSNSATLKLYEQWNLYLEKYPFDYNISSNFLFNVPSNHNLHLIQFIIYVSIFSFLFFVLC